MVIWAVILFSFTFLIDWLTCNLNKAHKALDVIAHYTQVASHKVASLLYNKNPGTYVCCKSIQMLERVIIIHNPFLEMYQSFWGSWFVGECILKFYCKS